MALAHNIHPIENRSGNKHRTCCLDEVFLLMLLALVSKLGLWWYTKLLIWVHPKSFIHWGRVTHIRVSKLTIIGSDNDLSPGRRRAIIWNSAGILLNWPFGTNFREILIEFKHFRWRNAFENVVCETASTFLGLNKLNELNFILQQATGWNYWVTTDGSFYDAVSF